MGWMRWNERYELGREEERTGIAMRVRMRMRMKMKERMREDGMGTR